MLRPSFPPDCRPVRISFTISLRKMAFSFRSYIMDIWKKKQQQQVTAKTADSLECFERYGIFVSALVASSRIHIQHWSVICFIKARPTQFFTSMFHLSIAIRDHIMRIYSDVILNHWVCSKQPWIINGTVPPTCPAWIFEVKHFTQREVFCAIFAVASLIISSKLNGYSSIPPISFFCVTLLFHIGIFRHFYGSWIEPKA